MREDIFGSLFVLFRSGDTEWHEGQAGSAGEGERETAGQEGAVQGTPAVSSVGSCSYRAHSSATDRCCSKKLLIAAPGNSKIHQKMSTEQKNTTQVLHIISSIYKWCIQSSVDRLLFSVWGFFFFLFFFLIVWVSLNVMILMLHDAGPLHPTLAFVPLLHFPLQTTVIVAALLQRLGRQYMGTFTLVLKLQPLLTGQLFIYCQIDNFSCLPLFHSYSSSLSAPRLTTHSHYFDPLVVCSVPTSL